jgi:NTE family protein
VPVRSGIRVVRVGPARVSTFITSEPGMSSPHLRREAIAAIPAALAAVATVMLAPADLLAAVRPTAEPSRPKVGLVLAGGGAKGGAHVGVLKVLEEQHVPIDCIAGTSMGALVGAGYAAGMPAADLEKFITSIDWDRVVGGVGRRPLEPIDQKRLETLASSDFELGIKDGAVVSPGGLTKTSGIDDLLRSYVAQARTVPDFDRLPIPYRAVATDMVTGTMVVLDHGDLATAMRASMAIPGAFAPVMWDKWILSDGGQVRNLPVDVARETCADVVIAVNLVVPPTPPEKLVQAQQLVARSMEVMLQSNVSLQLATLTERDVRIDVPMGDIGTADFERVPETIPLGETAARKAANQLARYSVPPAQYAAWRQKVTVGQGIETRVADVRFEGVQAVNPEYLRSLTTIEPGDVVDSGKISADASRMAALDDLDSVSYRFDGDPANPTLVWLPQETSVGNDRLRPSMGVFAGGQGDVRFLLGVQYVRHWLNPRGGQWRNNLQVGYESLLTTSWYQPLDVAQRWFVEPKAFASRSIEDLFVDDERVAVYRFSDVGGGLDMGANLGKSAQVRVGYLYALRKADLQTGIGNLPSGQRLVPEIDAHDAGIAASAFWDSRDEATFSTGGFAAEVRYLQSDESLGADRNWNKIEAAVRTPVDFDRYTMWVSLAGGTSFGDDILPGDRAFVLGGPRSLPAFQFDELRVRQYWLGSVLFLWPLRELLAVRNQTLYGGLGLQAAGLYDRVDLVPDGEVYGASAFLGGPTPVGALTLGIAGAEESWAVWLTLGRPIGHGSILDEGLFR